MTNGEHVGKKKGLNGQIKIGNGLIIDELRVSNIAQSSMGSPLWNEYYYLKLPFIAPPTLSVTIC